MRKRPVGPSGDDRVERHPVRASHPHGVLEIGGDLPFATSGTDQSALENRRPGPVRHPAGPIDRVEFLGVLDATYTLHQTGGLHHRLGPAAGLDHRLTHRRCAAQGEGVGFDRQGASGVAATSRERVTDVLP